ncbi:MAG TPA: glycosyltransferase family 1 protein [Solirubrobacteraceae bacterium]|jgi:glycosyltransferase involved in cell wall biosynthesis|nr:glycosyltransferase family 1 protein [Solirubrobacteraceae bacterium]
MNVGIDARAAAEVPAGRGRVVRELLRELAARGDDGHRYVLYARDVWHGEPLDERFKWRLLGARDPLWHALAARHANRECDVFLSCNSYLTTWLLSIPSVPIVYDLVGFEPSMRPNRRSAVIERATLGLAVRRSAALLAISEATADALADRFPAGRRKTVVAPLGVAPALDESLAPEEAALMPTPGFVLAVGTLEPRKNLPRLVAAYSSLDEAQQIRHPLVVVGASGWQTGETFDALRSLGERCQVLGYVSDAELAELYRRCAVFCYPSLGEGFGLPVLEAMAAGAAVVTSSLSSLPEVGGDAVEYVDPYDVPGIAAGLRAVLDDDAHRADLSARARTRAGEFSWERFATIVLATIDAAVGHTATAHVAADRTPVQRAVR